MYPKLGYYRRSGISMEEKVLSNCFFTRGFPMFSLVIFAVLNHSSDP